MRKLSPIAPNLNAFKFTFDGSLLNEIRNLYSSTLLSAALAAPENVFLHEGIEQLSVLINAGNYKFHLVSYGNSPLLWISSADKHTYDVFKRFVNSLDIEEDIKELVDFNTGLVMYCGFFVVGNWLSKENWHVDYNEGANGYTFITPLFELDASHGNLLYKDQYGITCGYNYKLNEGIIFGDRFWHSTEPYAKSQQMRVLLSFTIGTDKPEYWHILKHTVGVQSSFMYLPCGHQLGTCNCCT